jgi:hypothetical protein
MKPRTYLQTLINSLTSVAYYQQLAQTKLSFSLRFFFISVILLAMIRLLGFWGLHAPKLYQELAKIDQQLLENYPPNLKITWDGNTLSTNPTQPITLPFPSGWHRPDLPPYFALIDTSTDSLSEAQAHVAAGSLMVVTQKTLYLAQATQGYSTLPLSDLTPAIPSFTLTKAELETHHQQWLNQAWQTLQRLLLLISVLYPIYAVASVLGGVTLLSLFAWYVSGIFGQKQRWQQVWQLSLHLGVVAQIVHTFQSIFWPQLGLPLFSLSFWLYYTIVMVAKRKALPTAVS